MMRYTMHQLLLTTQSENAESASDWLITHGAVSVALQDAEDFPIYEPALETTPLWPVVQIIGLFTEEIDLKPLMETLVTDNLFSLLSPPESYALPDEDWIRKSIADFQPIHIAHNLWICPSWCKIETRDAVVINLDPGLAFGTGTHPTTALMLKFLAQHPPHNKTVIDYGCGSGILGLACAKLGAKQVMGVDIDPQALMATTENAARNQVSIETYLPHELPAVKADLIIANILLMPLMDLKEIFGKHLSQNGYLVLSGILQPQADVLIAHYQPQFQLRIYAAQENWVCVSNI